MSNILSIEKFQELYKIVKPDTLTALHGLNLDNYKDIAFVKYNIDNGYKFFHIKLLDNSYLVAYKDKLNRFNTLKKLLNTKDIKEMVHKSNMFCEICWDDVPAKYGVIKDLVTGENIDIRYRVATRCKEHKDYYGTYIDIKRSNYCKELFCCEFSSFGLKWMTPTHCKKHKTKDMENVTNKRCIYKGCKKQPTFGVEWKQPTHCMVHKTLEMEDVKSKRCEYKNCKKQPIFGIEWKNATHCKDHKTIEMQNVKNKRCQYKNCKTLPIFGLELGIATHCKIHKMLEMEDVVSKRCEYKDCKKRPNFGIECNKPIRCAEHKTLNMEDVTHIKCKYENCKIRPTFGIEWNMPIYCVEHKTLEMEDVVSKRCEYEKCKKHPSFGLEWMRPTHCIKHKTIDMEDVIHIRCQYKDCNIRPTFGVEWRVATHCIVHKTLDMENVKNKRCGYKDCTKQPSFGLEWMKPTHCKDHKSLDMDDVINKRCEYENCNIRPNFGKDSNNITCCYRHADSTFVDRYGDVKNTSRYSRCELYIQEILQSLDLDYIYDSPLENCHYSISNRRFDFLVYYNDKKIIIEYDGEQHFKFVERFHKTESSFLYSQSIDVLKMYHALLSDCYVIRLDYTIKTKKAISDFLQESFKTLDSLSDIDTSNDLLKRIVYSDRELYEYIINRLDMNREYSECIESIVDIEHS